MDKQKCNTVVLMEENYATLSVRYDTLKMKRDVLKYNDDAVEKFNITADVYIKPLEPGNGKVVFEFSPTQNRDIGKYFEYIIKKANLVCE
jgi:hypothetical protein